MSRNDCCNQPARQNLSRMQKYTLESEIFLKGTRHLEENNQKQVLKITQKQMEECRQADDGNQNDQGEKRKDNQNQEDEREERNNDDNQGNVTINSAATYQQWWASLPLLPNKDNRKERQRNAEKQAVTLQPEKWKNTVTTPCEGMT